MSDDELRDSDDETGRADENTEQNAQDDPFERLGEDVADREGDPFAELNDARDTGSEADGPEPSEPSDREDVEQSDERAETDDPVGESRTTFDEDRREKRDDDPLGDVGPREGDPFEGMEETFEEMDVDSVDPDEIWQDLVSVEGSGSMGKVSERTYADVSKHRYCEQCEFVSEPPDLECTHEGTEIVEFLDMDTVRVVDCPIVAERRELESE